MSSSYLIYRQKLKSYLCPVPKVHLFLIFLSLLFFSVPCPAETGIPSEQQIDSAIRSFDYEQLGTQLEIFRKLNKDEKLTGQDYYLAARSCEGLLRYYEAIDSNRKVSEIVSEGIRYLEQALAHNDRHSDSHRLLSRFYAKQLNWSNGFQLGPKVIEELDLALKYDPLNKKAILGKIGIYLYAPPMFGGNIDLALKQLLEYTDNNPDLEDGFINLGIAYKFKGDHEKARVVFNDILKKNPANLTAGKELSSLSQHRSSSAWEDF